jgi:uncharacterized protein (DUF4415 family)
LSCSTRRSKKLKPPCVGTPNEVRPAAAAFADEIDTAIAEITRLPLAWPAYSHNTRRFLLRRLQRRVSRVGKHHPGRGRCPRPSPAGLLEGPSALASHRALDPTSLAAPTKETIAIRLDSDVLGWFNRQGTGY